MAKITDNCRLIISCGGTGGHFYPGLSVARTLHERGGKVLLLISGKNAKKQCAIAENYGVRAIRLPDMPSPSKILNVPKFILGFLAGLSAVKGHIHTFAPTAVLGMGSFTSAPVIIAARMAKVKIFLHDGNARVGRANRIGSRFAEWLGTAYPAVNLNDINCHCEQVGMPLRPEILNAKSYSKEEAITKINRRYGAGLHGDKSTVLVIGGSQGAATLNKNIPIAMRRLGNRKFQVIHLAGPEKHMEVKNSYIGSPFSSLTLAYADDMELFYQATDLVISRSGGSTLAEIFHFGVAAVLIPYPYSAEGHQWDNAYHAVEHEAAVAIDNSKFSSERIFELMCDFLENRKLWRERAIKSRQLASPNATDVILEKISN